MIATLTLNPSLDEWVELESLTLGALNRAESFHRYPGGKGINVSRVAHELRQPTLAIAFAGGLDGQALSHLLGEEGLAHRFIHVRGATRNNYQLLTRSPKAITQINSPGPVVPRRALRELTTLLNRISRRTRCLVCSGSLPPGLPGDTYASLIRRAKAKRLPTVLDSSGEGLRRGVAAKPWLIKPNRQEAEELLGRSLRGRQAVINAARELASTSASVAIISLAAEGAVMAFEAGRRVLAARAPKVPVRSTIGAGDSLVAGFVTGWLRTGSLEHAFRLGMACGTAAVMTPGTQLSRRADVRRILSKITLSDVSPRLS